jgi:hypothetical protein
MKVDSRCFPESICTPESKSIHGRGGHHKLLLFWNPNVTVANATPFPSCPSFLSNKTEHMMRASLPLYHLPLMTLLVVLMFNINLMIYVLD